jgi:inosine-uridine nucleoside N-ribohydrolase
MRLLIDTDPGIDDALALLLAFASPEATVEAITTVAGHVGVDQATRNLFRILEMIRPTPQPIIGRGAATPLGRPLVTSNDVHGDDGLGNLDRVVDADGRRRYAPLPSIIKMREAADVILETADRLREELILVAIGPLTNLATALRKEPHGLSRVGRIVVMGGAIVTPGNITPAAEFNFYVDPEAAAAVFEAGLPVELVPLDATRQAVLRQSEFARRLDGSASAVARFVADFTRHGFAFGAERGDAGITLHDPLALALALDPSLAKLEPFHVEVECEGRVTRGMSVADRRPMVSDRKRPPNCRVALSVDAPRFLRLFIDRLCPASA